MRALTAVAVLSVLAASASAAEIEGYGKNATGGAGQAVCVVQNNIDECMQPNNHAMNRVIVFANAVVSGPPGNRYVGDNVTIDGCANGQNGVTIQQPGNAKRGIIVEGPAENVVIRCVRFQGHAGGKTSGASTEFDLLALDGESGLVANVLIDRVTAVGATDGALDITGNVQDVTVQRSLIYGTPLAQLIKYGQRRRISLHHNVYTGNGERNPQIHGDVQFLDFVSNVIHDCSLTEDGMGNRFDPYGLRVDQTSGPARVNVEHVWAGCPAQFYGTGGSVYTADVIGPQGFDGYGQRQPPPAEFAVTPTQASQLVTMLPMVGSPNLTPEDQARLAAVAASLGGPAPTPTPTPTTTPTPSPSPTPSPTPVPTPTPCPDCPCHTVTLTVVTRVDGVRVNSHTITAIQCQ